MGKLCDVLLPGPWWHPLTYQENEPVQRGCRVRVPVGKGERIGIVLDRGVDASKKGFSWRTVSGMIDTCRSVPEELLQTLHLAGRHFLCGPGELMNVAFPAPFFAGEHLPPVSETATRTDRRYRTRFERDARDSVRFGGYLELLEENEEESVLVIFPEKRQAERFWETLPERFHQRGILWPQGNGKRVWKAWEKTLQGERNLIVGTMGAIFAPLAAIGCVIVENEGSPAFYSRRYPFIHARTVLAYRARYWNAELLLGGGMPSSRSFLFQKEKCEENVKGRLVYVDRRQARELEVRGVQQPLPVCDAILLRTQEAIARDRVVLWLLDRIGYAAGVWCRECGEILNCGKCGTPLRWESRESVASCPFCKSRQPIPESCPKCGGAFMEGTRPGIEASSALASSLLGGSGRVHEWHGSMTQERTRRKRLLKALSEHGGIITGSRKALALCDEVPVGLICWLDVDMELFRPSYDVRYKAYRMVWESLWRGPEPEKRTVILQSRKPGSGWQRFLEKGWHAFWETELQERRGLDLPPWKFLVEVQAGKQIKRELIAVLEQAGIECMDPDPEQGTFWARTGKTEPLRKAVEPFFSVSRSRQGFPRMKVWID